MLKRKDEQLFSRRDTLRWLGAAGATTLIGTGGAQILDLLPIASPHTVAAAGQLPKALQAALFAPAPVGPAIDISQVTCLTKPALTEGPYFIDERLNRSDIRSDPTTGAIKAGVPLRIQINVYRAGSSACTPLSGALVDVWHCDALGNYAGVAAGMGNADTRNQEFLRGYQVTDAQGSTNFLTIYPGWYSGRAVHIHFKIRLFSGTTRTFDYTSQFFFDEALNDVVHAQAPYNQKGRRNTFNTTDNIYQSGGSQLLLSLAADGQGGYTATFNIGLANVPTSVGTVGASSAASFRPSDLAPEAIGALFGTDLATSTTAASSTPLPTTLGGVQVLVRDALGVERPAPLFFAAPSQINFQVPAGTSAGTALLSVLRNNTGAGQGTIAVNPVAPGLFAANANGQGVVAAVALRQRSDGTQTFEPVIQFDQTQNTYVAVPIALGAETDQVFLIAYGTGFRNRTALSAARATIFPAGSESDSVAAEVTFAGAQGDLVGVDQTNILLPRSLAGRGQLDLVLNVDGIAANRVSFSVS